MEIRPRALLTKLCIIFTSCSAPSSWIVDSIAAGDFSRLRFVSVQAHPPLIFEMVKYEEHIEAFLSLNRFRFTSNPVQVQFTINGKSFTEETPVHEGAMRIKLSEAAAERVIQALQNGLEVGILVDGFEEHLTPTDIKGIL